MKNDTLSQTHHAVDAAQHAGHNAVAANPADNAPKIPSIETALRELIALHDNSVFICGEGDQAEVDAKLQDAANALESAPRLKRERDELLDLLLEALPYVKEGEEFNKPNRRTLSKRILARLEKGGAL